MQQGSNSLTPSQGQPARPDVPPVTSAGTTPASGTSMHAGNLVLIGYMGTGKSSVGRLLARFGRLRFVDTDDLIVEKAGRSIPEIFATDGMEHFRQLETSVLRELQGATHTVIATGGGIVTRAENAPLLHSLGTIVWLTADEDVIFERVSRNRNRPMLHTENPRETLHNLLQERLPMYRRLGQVVADTSWLAQGDVAHAILNEVRRRQSSPLAKTSRLPVQPTASELP